jgi:NAD-dependent deacetylase
VAMEAGVTREGVARLVREAGTVVALSGAGISVPSGIPDFRSPGTGLWADSNPMEVAHIDAWRRDPERFWSFYDQRFQTLDGKQPNGAHHALVELEERGVLDAVITQNIDGLHRAAGTRELVEVHGTIATSSCLECGWSAGLDEVRRRVIDAQDGVPRCGDCAAPLKPDVVLFGELLPVEAIERAQTLCATADVLLCIGTSLEVYPVSALPELTHASGGDVVIITKGPTSWDSRATFRLGGDVVEELDALVEAL